MDKPDFSGCKLDDATKAEIAEAYPGMDTYYVPNGSIVTSDFRTNRIRVWFDEKSNVISSIRIG